MENYYKAPKSDLIDQQIPDAKYFKVSGIGLATFFGSALAGGILLSLNFKRAGDINTAKKALVLSIIGTIAIFASMFILPDSVPSLVFTAVQVGIMLSFAKQYMEDELTLHVANGGQLESNWKAFGISLLVFFPIIAVVFGAAFLYYQWVGGYQF